MSYFQKILQKWPISDCKRKPILKDTIILEKTDPWRIFSSSCKTDSSYSLPSLFFLFIFFSCQKSDLSNLSPSVGTRSFFILYVQIKCFVFIYLINRQKLTFVNYFLYTLIAYKHDKNKILIILLSGQEIESWVFLIELFIYILVTKSDTSRWMQNTESIVRFHV